MPKRNNTPTKNSNQEVLNFKQGKLPESLGSYIIDINVINDITIYETSNYDIFDKLEGNRPIRKSHVYNLMRSIRETYLPTFIIVNEKMQIIDGQHRLEALMKLEYPVNFIVTENLTQDDAIRMNINSANWSMMDYIDSYIALGYEDYNELKRCKEYYNIPTTAIVSIMSGKVFGSNASDIIRSGSLQIANKDYIKTLEYLKKIKENINDSITALFVNVILSSDDPLDVLKEIAHKTETQDIKFFRSVNQMRLEVDRIYNFRKRNVKSLFNKNKSYDDFSNHKLRKAFTDKLNNPNKK